MLILIADAFDSSLPGVLSRHGDVTDDKSRLADADVVLVRSKTTADRAYLDSAKNLKLIIRGGVGMDNIDIPYAESRGVICRNTADASTTAVAELAMALIIALPNKIVMANNALHEGKWLKKEAERTELFGKTLAILGLGRIGTAVAVRARAFQMQVLGWHPDKPFSDFADIRPDLEDVLSEADFVSLHMPLVDSTRGLINKRTLAYFKDGAFLVNTSRGKIVVEEDIAEALKSGKLGGFGTDVFHKEPPDDTPLLHAPNCILLPHIGASTKENMLRIGYMIDRIIGDFVKGKA